MTDGVCRHSLTFLELIGRLADMSINNFSISDDETLDSIGSDAIQVIQARRGPRFAIDSLLLAYYAGSFARGKVMDLGCGNGVISLWLARNSRIRQITGIDINETSIHMARRSAGLNRSVVDLSFETVDVARISSFFEPETFDTVVFNPPYRRAGTGKISPIAEKAAAHHELSSHLEDFIKAAFYLLKTGGRCVAIHLSERMAEIMSGFRRERLEIKHVRCIHAYARSSSKQFLFVSQKGARPGVIVERPLVIYRRKGIYASEVKSLLFG